jgi:transcription elongation GreA/GreB family factor
MSRAFVKESDDLPDLPDRPVSPHPNLVTPRGLALIEAAVETHRQALAAAQAAADRDRVAAASRELRYWTARRASAEVQPAPADCESVRFGAKVTIERDDGRRQAFRIVGEDEADPAAGTLSYVAPLARALIGREAGDTVRVGDGEAEILTIEI